MRGCRIQVANGLGPISARLAVDVCEEER